MSKKTQKNQPEKKDLEIVDQQRDPMLRALQKKIRNMNKKLNQIAQLENKKDLKPEQEQKVSRKNQVIQEKEKYLQMIEVYKQIAAESEKVIRKTQLAQLEDLAQILAAREYNANLGAPLNKNVENYTKVLTTPTSNDLTLKQRIQEIAGNLIEAANNTKLKKALKQFILANPDTRNQVKNTPAEKNQQPVIQSEPKVQKQQIKQNVIQTVQNQVQAPAQVKAEQTNQQQTLLTTSVPVVLAQKQQTQQKPTEAVQQPKVTPTQNNVPEGQKPSDGKQVKQQRKGNRGYRGDKNNRNERNNGQQRPYKKTFKPKYDNQQKQAPQKDRSSSSSLSSQPQARQFKREQIRELIQDGFIVIGKPKIKAKDSKEYKQFYDHQHGKKYHHQHNSKRNF